MVVVNARNPHYVKNVDGEDCVVFTTNGKRKVQVIVDRRAWEEYLHQYNWTAIKKGGLTEVKTTKDNHSFNIARKIVEEEFNEIDYFGRSVDHINNDRLDNRLKNLRLYSAKQNASNIKSKYEADGMEMIFPQRRGKRVYGYKVHTNVFDETLYASFRTVEEAKYYRDTVVKPYIEQRLKDLEKKTRDVEFERGLRDKLANGEIEEVQEVLKRGGVI